MQADSVMMTRVIGARAGIRAVCHEFRVARYFDTGFSLYCVQWIVHWLLELLYGRNHEQGRQQEGEAGVRAYVCDATVSKRLSSLSINAGAANLTHADELVWLWRAYVPASEDETVERLAQCGLSVTSWGWL